MGIMGKLSNPQVLEGWARLASQPLKNQARPARTPTQGDTRPYNAVKRLVVQALRQADRPVLPAEVRRLIEATTGETIAASSIKDCLSSGSRQVNGAFVRETDGYRLRLTSLKRS